MSFPTVPLRAIAACAVLAGALLSGPALAAGEPLVVYTARKYQLVDQLFQEYAKERGIRIYLAMVPDVHNLENYPFRAIHEQMRGVAAELGYVYVDLLPGFGSLDPAEIWAMPGDPHPNALGHQIMAEQLFPVLDRQR